MCERCGKPARRVGLCHKCYDRFRQTAKPPSSPRQRKRRSDSYLTRRQIYAAHDLYKAGMNMNEIARAGWEKWGYSTWLRAAIALSLAFQREGFEIRDNRTAQKLRWAKDERPNVPRTECAGCGCGLDDRSFGCDTCKARHWWRRRRNAPTRQGEGADASAILSEAA